MRAGGELQGVRTLAFHGDADLAARARAAEVGFDVVVPARKSTPTAPRSSREQRTRTRTVDLHAALPSPGGARAAATLKDRGGPPYPLRLYLERRGTRWVVTRIGDA
jgi:hypothetical protein